MYLSHQLITLNSALLIANPSNYKNLKKGRINCVCLPRIVNFVTKYKMGFRNSCQQHNMPGKLQLQELKTEFNTFQTMGILCRAANKSLSCTCRGENSTRPSN